MTDVLPTQDAAGAVEAGKSTLQSLKTLIGLPYKVYSAIVNTGSVTLTDIHSDFAGTTFAATNPFNGVIRITANSAVFTTGLTYQLGSALTNGGVPYFVTGAESSTTVFNITIIKYDGTQISTPNTTFFFEIRVYN